MTEDEFRTVAYWLIFAGTSLFTTAFLGFLVFHSWGASDWILEIVADHFAATVGLPLAAIAAICIVFLFKFVSGAIELAGFGFKFRGAAAPVILWMFCFLAIAAMIKLLW